jgi:hypothetical protein
VGNLWNLTKLARKLNLKTLLNFEFCSAEIAGQSKTAKSLELMVHPRLENLPFRTRRTRFAKEDQKAWQLETRSRGV